MRTIMTVIPARCVPTLKDPTSVAVFEATKGTAEHAQILMNVQVLKQIPVTLMPCVPTLRVLTFVAVYKGIVVMGKIVQI